MDLGVYAGDYKKMGGVLVLPPLHRLKESLYPAREHACMWNGAPWWLELVGKEKSIFERKHRRGWGDSIWLKDVLGAGLVVDFAEEDWLINFW